MTKRVSTSDCEGPLSKDDNAYDLSEHFIEKGNEFFPRVSKIDDVWADNIKQPGYKAGDTLRLILPFLKAYGATSEGMKKFSAEHLHLVRGSIETLRFVKKLMPSFIVSTSYRPYISAFCDATNFPEENVYCTEVDIDKYPLPEAEKKKIMDYRKEIVEMPIIEIPEGASKLENFSLRDQKTIERLYEIFWREIPSMQCGVMLKEVNPVGGWGKADAVKAIAKRTGCSFSNMSYIGDSITDVQSFQLVRKAGGLTVSFNGNRYAVREAEIAVLSENTIITSVLMDVFNRFRKKEVIDLVKDWSYNKIQTYSPDLYSKVCKIYPDELPKVELITDENRERLSKESSVFRKTVRGEAIGNLG